MQEPGSIPIIENVIESQPSFMAPQRTVIVQEQQPIALPSAPSIIIGSGSSRVRMMFSMIRLIIIMFMK